MISLSKRVLLSLFIFFSALYAIDITNCTNISYSGVYELTTNVSGAPLSTEEFGVAAANWTCIKVASSDVVFDCKGYNITNNATENASGVSINGSTTIAYNNVTIRNCQNISNYTYGLYVYNSTNSIIYNNTFLNNTYGVSLNSFYYGIFENNTINYSTSQSVALSSYYTNFTNNYLDNGLNSGFTASGDNNRYTNNTIFNHAFRAVQISGDYGVYTYNIIINASVGFYMEQADNNTIENNTITRTFYDGSFPASSGAAIYLTLGGDNNITNNNLTGNLEGVHIDARLSNSLMRNTIYNNSVYGIHLSCPDGNCDNDTISMNSDHLYNNGFDLYINSSHTIGTYIINFTTIVLDNPYGSYENYTNVTIRDFLNSSEETYWINWTSNSSSLPAGTTRSFAQKFINITSYNTSRTIDLITWHWSDAELIFPYNESRFVLYRYNGSWLSVPNQSLDITNNCLNASNLGAFSDFGILQDNSPPNVTQPSILPATAYTNNTLNATTTYSDTDNHTGNVTFVWFLNNSNIYNTTFLNVANNTILTSNLSGTNFSHFDLVNVTVYAFDGTNYSQNFTSTNTINISNTIPVVTTPSLLPTTVYKTNNLNATTTYTDLDLDSGSLLFMWYVNNVNLFNQTITNVANNTAITSNLSNANFSAFDYVNVSVQANDSYNVSVTQWSSTLQIQNLPPNITQPSILPATAYTNNTLNATTTYSDTDNHTGNVTFVWFLNNSNIYNTTFLNVANNTIMTSNLSGTNFSHFDLINVTVYAFDGANYSQNFTSTNTINISNTIPVLSNVYLIPNPLYRTTNANASVNYTDLDLDRANITFVWYVNSTNVYNYTASNVANGTNVSSVLSASYYNVSDVVNVSVYANDSYNLSITRNASRTVQSSLINNVSVTPSSGYAGELFTFTTNASSATAVNVSFGGITLQLTNTSSEMWNYTSYAVNLNPGTYTLNFTAISGYDDSFSDTSLSITILLRSTTGSDTVEQSLSLSKRERCPENEVTFYTSQDAEVRLLLSNPYEGLIASKTVGSSGSVTFVLTKAGTYEATASKTGYKSATLVFTYALCAPVANETNVTTNQTTNDTVNPPPPPLPPPPPDGKKGCTTNSECTDAQYCSGGSCIDVSSGSCGYLSNHSWFQYACCNDSDCNAGYVCFEHACIERNITIVAAEKAYIGSTEAIQVLANGKPLSNALIQVSVPNGETIQLTTDNEGKATFQLQYKGDYKIAVVEGGSPLKTRVLLSMTKTSAEDKKTSSYLFMENEWILTGAVVMFLAIALIVYYFYTRKKSDSGPYTSKFRKK